jgi:hypothetical protein
LEKKEVQEPEEEPEDQEPKEEPEDQEEPEELDRLKSKKLKSKSRTSTTPKMSIPQIRSIEWGNVQIGQNSKIEDFKDVVLEPTTFYNWDFKEGFDPNTDQKHTSHQYKKDISKGIQPHSVRNLLDKGTTFILTTGFHDDLGVNQKTIKFLENNGKKVVVVNSSEVMDLYNKLSKKSKVVALVHSTC